MTEFLPTNHQEKNLEQLREIFVSKAKNLTGFFDPEGSFDAEVGASDHTSWMRLLFTKYLLKNDQFVQTVSLEAEQAPLVEEHLFSELSDQAQRARDCLATIYQYLSRPVVTDFFAGDHEARKEWEETVKTSLAQNELKQLFQIHSNHNRLGGASISGLKMAASSLKDLLGNSSKYQELGQKLQEIIQIIDENYGKGRKRVWDTKSNDQKVAIVAQLVELIRSIPNL